MKGKKKDPPMEALIATPSLAQDVLSTLTTPTVSGTLTGALLALIPYTSLPWLQNSDLGMAVLATQDQLGVPSSLTLGVMGWLGGYVTMRVLRWARRQAIKKLLQSKGWIHNPRAPSTKVWAITLRVLLCGEPFYINEFSGLRPKLPVPKLKDTRERYLRVAKVVLTDEEFQRSKKLWDDFLKGEGPELQALLEERADKEDCWMGDWWLKFAYLINRNSLINTNFYLTTMLKEEVTTTKQLPKAANIIAGALSYHNMMRTNTIRTTMLQGLIPLCMDRNRYLLSSVRLPGDQMDSIKHYPESTHCVICRKGHYYKVELYHKSKGGSLSPLTIQEIRKTVGDIYAMAENLPEDKSDVSMLTSESRPTWARVREALQKDDVNAATLETIESSICVIFLSENPIESIQDLWKKALGNKEFSYWYDKSICFVVYPGGVFSGNMEHGTADAMNYDYAFAVVLYGERYGPDGEVPHSDLPLRPLDQPQKLEWRAGDFKGDIEKAKEKFFSAIDDLDLCSLHGQFAKGWIKTRKISPDGFYQMALQLAYYRIHGEVTKTYEAGTTRIYRHGRTETIHPISDCSRAFVERMDNPDVSPEEKISCLRQAVKHQVKVKTEAVAGQGIDRHMMGLLLTAKLSGRPVPELFTDKMPYVLSTSQGPCDVVESGVPIIPESSSGGFPPPDPTCYGVCYLTTGEDVVNFSITCWKSSGKSAKTFQMALQAALADMKQLLE